MSQVVTPRHELEMLEQRVLLSADPAAMGVVSNHAPGVLLHSSAALEIVLGHDPSRDVQSHSAENTFTQSVDSLFDGLSTENLDAVPAEGLQNELNELDVELTPNLASTPAPAATLSDNDAASRGNLQTALGTASTSATQSAPPVQQAVGSPNIFQRFYSAADKLTDTLHGANPPPASVLIVIDPAVDQIDTLISGVTEGTDFLILDAAKDAIQQISSALAHRSNLAALHIFSHGNRGSITLGRTSLSQANLTQFADSLQAWGQALAPNGDILLYGCNVASAAEGQQFLETFAALTNADVAASTNLTGSSSFGGDWILERQVGVVNDSAQAPLSQAALANFNQSLIAPNLAPSIAVPQGQSVSEDVSLAFGNSVSPPNPITISDLEAGAAIVKTTITVTNGVVSLRNEAIGNQAITITTGDGVEDLTIAFDSTIADANFAIDGLLFAPDSDFNGTATITFSVDDLGNTGSGGAKVGEATMDIQVNPSNDGPAITVPTAQTVTEDGSLVFSTANSNAISISDIDGASQGWEISLSATQGQLLLAGTPPFSQFEWITGDGSAAASLKFLGSTLAEINAALDGLTFIPNSNYHGAASVNIASDDEWFASPASPKPGSKPQAALLGFDSDSVNVTVSPVPDTPSATGSNTLEDQKTTTGLTIFRSEVDGTEVTHFKIYNISAGTLYQNDGTTVINNNDFITVAQGEFGLKFLPSQDSIEFGTFSIHAVIDAATDILSIEPASVDIEVTPVNDPPTFTPGTDVIINEDASSQTLTNWGSVVLPGPANESTQTFTVNVAFTNPGLFEVGPALDTDGTLSFTPNANEYGSSELTITIQDNGGTLNGGDDTTVVLSLITINPINDAPSFTAGIDQSVLAGASLVTVSGWATGITAGPINEGNQTLTFVLTPSNSSLFAVQPAVDGQGTLTYQPGVAAGGLVTVTARLQDNGGTTSGGIDFLEHQFTIDVLPVNQPPQFVNGINPVVNEDSGAYSQPWVDVSPGHPSESGQTLSFAVTTPDSLLFSVQPAVTPSGTLSFTVAPNVTGVATLNVTLQDNGGTANGGSNSTGPVQYTITINEVNDPPSFTLTPSTLTPVNEDSAPGSFPNFVSNISSGPLNEENQVVDVVLTFTNAALFSSPPALDQSGNLTWTLAPNAFGDSLITVTATDDGGTASGGINTSSQNVTLTVKSVNDAPSFTPGGNQTVNEDSGAHSVSNWATNILAGPTNEAGQALSFSVSPNNPSLFSVQPAISQTGTLSYTLAPNASGTAILTLQLTDDGGTANGGVNATTPITANIVVTPIEDPPTFTSSPVTSSTVPTAYSYTATVADLDPGATLTLTGVTIPAWMSFVVTTNQNGLPSGALTGTPTVNEAGNHPVTLRVTDGVNPPVDQTFTITVEAPFTDLEFNVGAYLRVTVLGTNIVPISNPPANSPVATASTATVQFLQLPEFANISVSNMPLYQDGAQIDGFELSSLNLATTAGIGSGLNQFLSLGGVQFVPSFTHRPNGPGTTGSLAFNATGGTLFPASSSFNAVLEDGGNGGPALTFTINTNGAVSFSVEKLRVTFGTSATLSVTNAVLAYDPNGAANQTIASLANVTLDFAAAGPGVTATLDQLQIRKDGFSLSSAEVTIGTINLGSVISLVTPRLGVTNFAYTSGAALTGVITLKTGTASLTIGTKLSGTVTDGAGDPDTDAVVGSFDIANPSFSLVADQSSLTIPGVLTAQTTSTTIAYNPSGPANQTLFSIASFTATLIPLNNTTVTVTNLVVRKDGFSLDNLSVVLPNIPIAGILTITAPSLQITGFSYTTGGSLQGTFTIGATAATLTIGTLITGSVTDGADPDSFGLSGSYDLATTAFTLAFDTLSLTVQGLFSGSTAGPTFQYDPDGGQVAPQSVRRHAPAGQQVLNLPTFNANLTPLGAVAVSLVDLRVYTDGFSLANGTLSLPDGPVIGGVLTVNTPSLTFASVGYVAGGALQGSITLAANGASLSVGTSITFALSDGADADAFAVSGSYSLTTSTFNLTLDQLAVTVPNVLTANASSIVFSYNTGGASNQEVFAIASLNATIIPLNNSTVAVTNLRVRLNGFSMDDATVTLPNIPIAGVLTITAPSLSFSGVNYTVGSPLQGNLTLAANSATLALGTALTGSITDGPDADNFGLSGSFNLSTTAFALSLDTLSLNVPGLFSGSTTGPTFNYDPDNGQAAPLSVGRHMPTGQELIHLPTFSANLTPLGAVAVSLTDLRIRTDGFSLGNATINLTNNPVIGGVLTLNTPSLSFSNVSYLSGGSLQGSITLATAGAALSVGTGISFTISDSADPDAFAVAGTYNVGTSAFSLTLDQLALTIPNVLTASASSVVFGFSPNGPANQEVFAIGSLSATIIPLNNVTVSLTNLRVRQDGFSLDNATATLPNVPVGGVLTLTAPALSFSNVSYTSGGSVQGTLGLSTNNATLAVGSGISFVVSDGADPDAFAVNGAFDIATNAFALTLDQLALTVPGVLTANASGVVFAFNPNGAANQEVFAIASLTASIIPLNNTTVALSNLRVRQNGFSIDNASATLPNVPIGGVLTLTAPSLTFTNVSYTTGGNLQGTLGISTTSATLAVGTGITFAISDGADVDNFAVNGTFDVATTAFALTLDQLALTIPNVLTASASSVVFAFDPEGASNQEVFAIASLSATIIPLNNTSVNVSNLRVRQNGFSLDNATVTLPNIPIAGILTITAPTLSFNNFNYTTGSPLQGTLVLGAVGASLTIGTSLTASITDGADQDTLGLSGSFDLATTAFTLNIDTMSLSVPGVFSGSTTGPTFRYDPDGGQAGPLSFGKHMPSGQEVLHLPTFTATLTPLGSVNVNLTDLRIRTDGFTLGSGSIAVNSNIPIGGVLTVNTPSISFSSASYVVGGSLQGTITLSANGATLAVGSGISFVISDGPDQDTLALSGSYNLTTTAFSITLDQLALTVPNVLTASASGVVFGYDPDSPASQEIIVIASLTATIIPITTTASVADLRVRTDGFSLGAGSISLPTLSIGGFLTITSPTIQFLSTSYTTGGSLQGTISVGAATATLYPGRDFTGSITDGADPDSLGISGGYNLSTSAWGLTVDQFALTVPNVFIASATGMTIGFNPTGPSSQTLFSLNSGTISFPRFGLTGTLSNLVVRGDGFQFGSLTVSSSQTLSMGSILQLTGLGVTITNFGVTYGQALTFNGSIALTATGASFFPGSSVFTSTLTNVTAEFLFTGGSLGALRFSVGQLYVNVAGKVSISALNVQINPDDPIVLSVPFASVTLTGLNITGSVTGLEVTSGGEVSVVSINISTQGFATTFGLGGLLPFDVTSLGVGFLGDTNHNGLRDSGETFRLDEFDLTVSGFFNFSKLGNLPFTPIIRIGPQGSQTIASSSNQTFTFTVTIENGTVRPKNFGPIEIGFADLRIGQSVVLGGTIILGGYQNGQWVNTFGGSISLMVSPTMSNISGGASIAILGSFNEQTGALDIQATLSVSFTLQGKVSITNASLGFSLSLRADSNFNVTVQSLVLNSASVQRVELVFGSLMTLTATNAVLNFNPPPNGNIATFETLSVQLTGLGIGGTARNFAISDTGDIRTLPGFGVSLNASAGALRWPSWLPIQITELGLTWQDFNADPLNFRIILSASVTGLQGLPVNVSGSVQGLVIDIGLLRQGRFPIVELGSASISISGNLFGGEVIGSIFLGMMRTDANGNIIQAGDTNTPVANRVLYGGIIAGFSISGLAGFEIRIGLSELGPLSVFVNAGIPILLEPNSGLTISNFRAGVTFNTSLPSITNPLDLRGAAFQPTGDLTPEQWQAGLQAAVLNQIRSGQTDFWQAFTQPMKIEGGATLYTTYTSSNVFRADIDLIISTDGKIMINGRFVFGNRISLRGVLYADLSNLLNGSGTFLFLMDLPAESPILTIRGGLTFGFTRSDGTAVTSLNQADNFELRIAGGVDLSALGLASLTIEGSVNIKFSPMPTPDRIDIDLSGEFYATLLGQRISLAGAAGVVRIDMTSQLPQIWGALAITSNLQFLEQIGIYANVSTIFRLNLTNTDRQEVLNVPGRGNITVDIKALSYSFLLEGHFIFRKDGADWFRMQGLYGLEISANDGLSLFAQGQLFVGPPQLNFLRFNFNGFLQLSSRGIAGMIDLSLAAQLPQNFGLSFNASFHLLMNTTLQTVTYTLPPSIVAVPGGGSNRTIVIAGKPAGSPPQIPNIPYLQIKATGSLTALALRIEGQFSLLVSPLVLNLQVSGTMSLAVGNTTFFRFAVAGGLNIDSTGAAGALTLSVNTGLPANLGFTLNASFRLEFNTTNRAQNIAGISLTAGIYAKVRADGYLQVAGLRITGYFEITVGPALLNFQAVATMDLKVGNTTIVGFNVSGGFQIDSTGIAAAFALSLRTQFPTGKGYSFSLTFRLEINTTNRSITLGGINLNAGVYARVHGQGTLTIGGFVLTGSFKFSVGPSSIAVEAIATMNLRVGNTTLFSFNVAGGFVIDTGGMAAAFNLSLQTGMPSGFGITLSVTFRLEINTTSTTRVIAGITLAPNTLRVFASGFLQIAGAFRFDGSFSITIAPDRLVIRVAATMGLFGVNVSVQGDFGLFADGMAANFSLTLPSINTSFFALSGSFSLSINTTNRTIFAVAPRTFLVRVTNARLTVVGVSLTGSLSIGIQNGVFRMEIPSSNPLTLSIANFFTVTVSGFVSGNGTFNITGTVNVNLGRADLVGITGTMSVTISNSGFVARLNGSVRIFNTQVASVGGNLTVSANDFNLAVWINFNFNISGVLSVTGGGTLNISRSGLAISFSATARLFNAINGSISASINTITGRYHFVGSASLYIGNSNLGVSASVTIKVANYSGSANGISFSSGFTLVISGSAWAGFKIAGHWVGASASLYATASSSGRFSVRVNACISLGFLGNACAGVTVNVDLSNGFRIWLSDIADADIFLDANKNGQRDADEPITQSDADGNFSFADVPAASTQPPAAPLGQLEKFDLNKNGQLDADEGRFVIRGGTDIETGTASTTDLLLEGTHVVGSTPLSQATVFFDTNKNGQLDSGEISTTTGSDGTFTFIAQNFTASLGLLAKYDTNRNGLLDDDEGRLRVVGGTMLDPATGKEIPGDQPLDNTLLAALSPATNAERIFFDANLNGKFDTDEVSVVPNAERFYSFLDLAAVQINDLGRLKPFDRNGNGVIDDSEGEFVVVGGVDKNTGLPNTQSIRLSAADYGRGVQATLNPLSEIYGTLRRGGSSMLDAHTEVQAGFGLPTHIQVDIFDPRQSDPADASFVPLVLRGSEKVNVLVFGGTAIMGGNEANARRAIIDETAAALQAIPTPEFIQGPNNYPVFPESLNLSDPATVRKILASAARRLNLTVAGDRLDATAQVIAALNRRVDAITSANQTGDLITALADVKALAQTSASASLKALAAGTKTPAQVTAEFTDAAISQSLGKQDLPPYIARISDKLSDGAAITVPVHFENPNGPVDLLTVSVASSNSALLPQGSVTLAGTGADRTLQLTPRKGFSGNATITVSTQLKSADGRTLVSTEEFILTVETSNPGPIIAPIADIAVPANQTTASIVINLEDRDSPAELLKVAVVSENETILPTSGILLTGAGTTHSLLLKPALDQFGSAGIVVEATDGVTTSTLRFVLNVLERNDGPSVTIVLVPAVIDPSAPAASNSVRIAENARTHIFDLLLADREVGADGLQIIFASDNSALVDSEGFALSGPIDRRTVVVNPKPGASGVANLTISVSDGLSSTVRTARLNVSSLNDAPVITPIPDQVIADGQSVRVDFQVFDDSGLVNLILNVKSSDEILLPDSALKFSGTGDTRTLEITPVSGVLGLATVTLSATDGQFTSRMEFLVSVDGANSAPRISRIADMAVALNGQSSLIAFSVFDRETAPSNLTVHVTSSNQQLLKPSSIRFGGFGSERTLVLSPEIGQTGTATVTLSITDGERTSTQSFNLKTAVELQFSL